MESFLSFSRWVDHATAGLKRGKKTPREGFLCPTPDSDSFSDAQFGKNLGALSRQFPAIPNRRFEFHKRSQLFIRTHNETLDRRHDARQQSRSFAPQNQGLIHSPNSSQLS